MARIVIIDFTKEEPVLDDSFMGYIGEHNETILSITPPNEMLEDPNVVSFVVAFGSGGKVYHSAAITREQLSPYGHFMTPVFKDVTGYEELEIQLEGYDSNRSLLAKTEVVYGYFEESVDGEDAIADEDAGIIADIAANTAARGKVTEHVFEFENNIEGVAGSGFFNSQTQLVLFGDYTAEGMPLHNAIITSVDVKIDSQWSDIYTALFDTAYELNHITLCRKPIVAPVDEEIYTLIMLTDMYNNEIENADAFKIHYINFMEAEQ